MGDRKKKGGLEEGL
jgi:hypothetical protein